MTCFRTIRAIGFLWVAVSNGAFAQTKTYIALGDSVAWGYQPNSTNRGNGDKGYVKQYADWLGNQNNNTRPVLINLGIPGETSSSFFDTSEIGGLLNSNYPVFGRKSQSELFKSKVTSELSAGHVIENVTFALGANDMLDLETTQFLALPFEQQTAQVDLTLVNTNAKLTAALTVIRQKCPNAKITVPGYYNPYGAYPGTAENRISLYAIPRLNSLLALQAKKFKAAFAPTYLPFVGHELELTWIGTNDVHPRDGGYTLIAQAVQSAFVVQAFGPAN